MCFRSWSTPFRRFEKCLMWNSEKRRIKLYIVNAMIKQTWTEWAPWRKGDEGKWRKILRHGWNTQLFICSDCDLNNKDWFFLSSSSSRLFTHIKCFSKLAKLYCVVPGLLTQKSMSEQIKGTEWKLLVKPLKPLKWLKLFVRKPFFHFHYTVSFALLRLQWESFSCAAAGKTSPRAQVFVSREESLNN